MAVSLQHRVEQHGVSSCGVMGLDRVARVRMLLSCLFLLHIMDGDC